MLRARKHLVVGAALVMAAAFVPRAGAESAALKPAERDVLWSASNGDPLELARLVDRIGDAAVLERLAPTRPAAIRLLASMAAREMHEPGAALPLLVETMGTREPTLAPVAARSVLLIVERMHRDGPERADLDVAVLVPVRARLGALAGAEHIRADIRSIAARAAWLLAELGVQ